MLHENWVFSLSICNVPAVSTHLTFVLFIRAVFMKGNYWYDFLQRPFFFFFQKICGIVLELYTVCKMTDSFPADRHLENQKLNYMKWKALKLLLGVWMNRICLVYESVSHLHSFCRPIFKETELYFTWIIYCF